MYTKEHLISQIKDKTIKRYLRENVDDLMYDSHSNMIIAGIIWDESEQGVPFWIEIYDHFLNFESGLTAEVKTYEDFKHLDRSIK